MNINTFDDLLLAARHQPDAQRLLMVFAAATLPDDCTAEQRARFEAGEGGELSPIMCVDKTPEELGSFAALQAESRQFGQPWVLVFVAGMSGQGPRAPTAEEARKPLEGMVQAIKDGRLEHFIPFDQQGQAVSLQ
ncbi:MAG TPA: ribonucleotide reductase subunit alpha [Aquabacterium sp.]|uniref:ribonucleotide reductase subunit alpha n=1 Tax=Aquabacterium sp. TaxID=1872578 RepID=UPI002E2F2535|nr:ribonucleotide reductase subunit alpha [Aquabacterium sp.]HEX5357237.1 ribonucleotide reductase subunit alpha [Aquabacterium sp.]